MVRKSACQCNKKRPDLCRYGETYKRCLLVLSRELGTGNELDDSNSKGRLRDADRNEGTTIAEDKVRNTY